MLIKAANLSNKKFTAVSLVKNTSSAKVDSAFIKRRQLNKKIINKIEYLISEIDNLLTHQLNAVLHHALFQQVEASWRGLNYLIEQTKTYKKVIIRVLNISWQEVARDIKRAADIDQSLLFKKIHDDEYGISGGIPFNVLLADYSVFENGLNQSEINVLKGLTQIGAASFAVFIAAVNHKLFGIDSFRDFRYSINFQKVFKQTEFLAWNNFRKTEDSRFLALLMPRILMRDSYRASEILDTGFLFSEFTYSNKGSDLLWGNPCYIYGVILARAFDNNGWFADIRGLQDNLERGGVCPPFFTSKNQKLKIGAQQPFLTEILISDAQDKVLSELGFVPLTYNQQSGKLVFYSAQTVQEYQSYDKDTATMNAIVSTMLPHILCACRFAHYLKKIGRAKLGLFWRADECQQFLHRWLQDFTMHNEGETEALRARYPLKDFQVKITELAGAPGHFGCVIHLQPHFQLENVSASMVFFTELIASK